MPKKFSSDSVLLQAICQNISDSKGFNVITLDVRGISSMTDYFIIAEGNVNRHVKALAAHVEELLSEHGRKPIAREGEADGEWVVLDYNDVIIHFFTPDMREKYALEQVWKEGVIVDVPLAQTIK